MCSLWDNFERPSPAPGEVPWHGEAVTGEWLTAVLARDAPGARVEGVTVLGGDNGSSARRTLALDWNREGRAASLPERLFTKSTPTLPMRLSAGKAAPAEGRFLTDLRPHLPIEAPRCFYTGRDPVSGRSLHLMNDLTHESGATFCRADSGIDRAQAEQIVDTLAVLHGTFLNGSCTFDSSFLRTYESFFDAAARNRIEAGHDEAMIRAAHVIPEGLLARKASIWPERGRGGQDARQFAQDGHPLRRAPRELVRHRGRPHGLERLGESLQGGSGAGTWLTR